MGGFLQGGLLDKGRRSRHRYWERFLQVHTFAVNESDKKSDRFLGF